MDNSELSMPLKELKQEIIEDAKANNLEVWFYPEYNGVKGFEGTQDIILLGLNPSSGTFPSEKDKILYEILKNAKFEDIHISDFIKVRAKNREVPDILKNKELVKKQVEFLAREIEIINPKVIITMGLQCDSLLKENLPDTKAKIIRIKHYGFRYQSQDEVFSEITEAIGEISGEYRG